MNKFKLFIKNIKSLVGCPKCYTRSFKKHVNKDGSFYWKCMHCLYESNVNKKK